MSPPKSERWALKWTCSAKRVFQTPLIFYLLRDDVAAESGFLVAPGEAGPMFAAVEQGQKILKYLSRGTVIAALTGSTGPDSVHFQRARHGHTFKLSADPLLWEQPPVDSVAAAVDAMAGAPADLQVPPTIAEINAQEILDTIQRYSGSRPLDVSNAARVTSRHIRHADNSLVTTQLAADLEAAGQGRLQVRLHRFTHVGLQLFNVEAELAGRSPELVLITAHLDSTAACQQPYDPTTDAAPGADDDGSGVAAVLTIAKRLAATAAAVPPERTVRFVLFNAEEQRLIGCRRSEPGIR
jgi:hypothetical protein